MEHNCSMLLDADDCQLLLVDYQARLMPAIHEHGLVLHNAVRLGRLAQLFDVPVWGVTDACGSRAERDRDAAFDRLAGSGCELVTTEMVAFEWLRSADHPAFHEALRIVKGAGDAR